MVFSRLLGKAGKRAKDGEAKSSTSGSHDDDGHDKQWVRLSFFSLSPCFRCNFFFAVASCPFFPLSFSFSFLLRTVLFFSCRIMTAATRVLPTGTSRPSGWPQFFQPRMTRMAVGAAAPPPDPALQLAAVLLLLLRGRPLGLVSPASVPRSASGSKSSCVELHAPPRWGLICVYHCEPTCCCCCCLLPLTG